MNLDLKAVLKSGIVWGIAGVLLALAVAVLGKFLPAGVQGLALPTFAVLFAGLQFAYGERAGWLMPLLGGALAGVVAALMLALASYVLPRLGVGSGGGGTSL